MQVLLGPGQYAIYREFRVEAGTYVPGVPQATARFANASSVTANFHATGEFVTLGAKDGAAVSTAKGGKYVQLLDRTVRQQAQHRAGVPVLFLAGCTKDCSERCPDSRLRVPLR